MKVCLLGLLVLLCVLNGVNGLHVSEADNFIRKEGYCMWYGQCGTNPLTSKAINCLYNGVAKPVDNSKSREILFELCPEFAHNDSKVCCSYDQLVSLQSGIQSAQQMMARCPGCWKNFRELYCRMTCSPNNSMFIDPTELSADKKSIVAIDYYVDKAFRDGLYNSCKNVVFPSSGQKIMSFMCGTAAENCTPLRFLDFMGNPEFNGVSPFLVEYPVTAKPGIKPMNATITSCNESFYDPVSKSTKEACDCQDCTESCKHPFPPIKLKEYLAAKVIFSLKPGSELNQRTCYKNFFSQDCVLTGTILRLGILQKVLKVQAHLMKMSVFPKTGSKNITLADFCIKSSSNNNCMVMSVLQYWQNDETKLNKCISVLTREPCSSPYDFKTASWGDHLEKCTDDPYRTDDSTALRLSCISKYGDPVYPRQVLGGYERKKYTDASLLFVTFAIKKHPNEMEIQKAKAWQEKFVEYVKNYDDKDLQLAYVPIDLPVRRLDMSIEY